MRTSADALDYLPPSRDLADAWLAEHGRRDWTHEVGEMIVYHHKLRS